MSLGLDWGTLALAPLGARLLEAAADEPGFGRIVACTRSLEQIECAWPDLVRRKIDMVGEDGVASLAHRLSLTLIEAVSVALCAAVERDLAVASAVARLQAPVAGSRPCVGLLAEIYAPLSSRPFDDVVGGGATRSGLLRVLRAELPLVQRPVAIAEATARALAGGDARWPGSMDASDIAATPLAESLRRRAADAARALASDSADALVIRTASLDEGRALCVEAARCLGRAPVFVGGHEDPGFATFAMLQDLQPVVIVDSVPGEITVLPEYAGLDRPVLCVASLDDRVVRRRGRVHSWVPRAPAADERVALWRAALAREDVDASNIDVEDLGRSGRWGCGEVADLAARSMHEMRRQGRVGIELADVEAAAWHVASRDLDGLADPIRYDVRDDALVVTDRLQSELDTLLARCRTRECLADGLGPAVTTRYRPGVRALFDGPPGTGKTLAASWLAGRLHVPLFRVDLAAVTSKYVGETEKHLSTLFARAERAEIVLLFDEADAMFGQRSDQARDSTDRFANAQTNYLLQRVEAFDGIVLLTTNARSSIDGAFARRLDAVLEFAMPSAQERRRLWWAHLGAATEVTEEQVNRLAARAALAGGNIRNIVLAAAVRARSARRAIGWEDLSGALQSEYRKIGKPVPGDFRSLDDEPVAAAQR